MILFVTFALEAGFAALLWYNRRALAQAESQIRRVHASLTEIECLTQARDRLRERQKKIEQTVDTTTDSVEAVHRALANLSFDLWGDAGARARHDRHAQQVYGGVRQVNRALGKWANQWLDDGETAKNDDD